MNWASPKRGFSRTDILSSLLVAGFCTFMVRAGSWAVRGANVALVGKAFEGS